MRGVLRKVRVPQEAPSSEGAPSKAGSTGRLLCTFWVEMPFWPNGRIRRITGEGGRELRFEDAVSLIARAGTDGSIEVRPFHDDNGSWALSREAKRRRAA